MIPQLSQWLHDDLTRRLEDVTKDLKYQTTCATETELNNLKNNSQNALLLPFLLHGNSNPQETIATAAQKLKRDGLLLCNLLGARTAQTGKIHLPQQNRNPLPDVRDVGNVLTSLKFALPVVDSQILTLTFDTIEKLNETAAHLLILHTPIEDLTPRPDSTYELPLEILTLTAWTPDKSQPKPLKPGQFKIKLEDALK